MNFTYSGFDPMSDGDCWVSNHELPTYPLDPDYRVKSDLTVSAGRELKEEYTTNNKGKAKALWERVKQICIYILVGIFSDD